MGLENSWGIESCGSWEASWDLKDRGEAGLSRKNSLSKGSSLNNRLKISIKNYLCW